MAQNAWVVSRDLVFGTLPVCRQQALLAAISEKDANIALLELSSSNKKKTQEEVMSLKREKDRLMQQLKQQVSLKHKHIRNILGTLTQSPRKLRKHSEIRAHQMLVQDLHSAHSLNPHNYSCNIFAEHTEALPKHLKRTRTTLRTTHMTLNPSHST